VPCRDGPASARARAADGGFLNRIASSKAAPAVNKTYPFASVWDLAKHIHGQNVEVCARSQRKRHAEDGRGRAHTMRNGTCDP
jgi:hypothetical protein